MAWLSGSLTSPRDAGGPRAGGSRLQMPNWMRVAVPGGEAIAPVGDVSIAIAGGATATIPGGVYATVSGSPALAVTTTHYITYVTVAAPSVLLACRQQDFAAIYAAADVVGIGYHTDHHDMRLPTRLIGGGYGMISLWTGGTNISPPTSWYLPSFDASTWPPPIQATTDLGTIDGHNYWTSTFPLSDTEQTLLRTAYPWPTGGTLDARTMWVFALKCDDGTGGVWINGTPFFVPPFPYYGPFKEFGQYENIRLPILDLSMWSTASGNINLVAIYGQNNAPAHAWISFAVYAQTVGHLTSGSTYTAVMSAGTLASITISGGNAVDETGTAFAIGTRTVTVPTQGYIFKSLFVPGDYFLFVNSFNNNAAVMRQDGSFVAGVSLASSARVARVRFTGGPPVTGFSIVEQFIYP